MRLIILSTAIFILFVSCSGDQEKAKSDASLTEAEVKDFIREYDAMWTSRDTGLMKQAMDDQYIYFTSTGSTRRRSDIISWLPRRINIKWKKLNEVR